MENSKVLQSTKWSAITELLAKVMTPVANIVLARLLMPEVFGVVATLTMVATFAEVFTDAGFQKYLVQHEFSDDKERIQFTNVAFWTNFLFSLLLWVVICIFRDSIAAFAGSPGFGFEVAVLSLQIPLVAMSSIQLALYRRDLRFKELMPIRIIVSIVPIFITVPAAFLLRNCWAVIIGNLVREIINATLLTIRSSWKPSLYYDIRKLKNMLATSLWLMADSLLIWTTTYISTFIVSRYLSSHYLGIYKQGATTINPYITLLYTMTAPVLFAAISRSQNDKQECDRLLLSFQKYASYFVMAIGFTVFVFHDLVTMILLGKNFMEASWLLGLIGFSLPINMLIAQYNSDYFRGTGNPKTALTVQLLYVAVLTVGLTYAAKQSFAFLCTSTGIIKLSYTVISCTVLCFKFKVSILRIIKNLTPALLSATGLLIVGLLTKDLYSGILWQFVSMSLSLIAYLVILMSFPGVKSDVIKFLSEFKSKKLKRI